MKKKYVVISLFNGMGCIWMALEKAGIQVSQRISSEVDKFAIKSNDAIYPDTIQVGDVRKINVIKDNNGRPIKLETENGTIDLLDGEIILGGGSPCQSFSFAGKMKGMSTKDEQEILTLDRYLELKGQQYEFEGQSYLFWEYMRIKKDLNPKHFLLENVIMVDKWKNVLSRAIGINPIRINSSLVSAQSRDRYYWTDIYTAPQGFFGDLECMIPQPKDKGILLRDILESNVDEKYFLNDKKVELILNRPKNYENKINPDKTNTLRTNYSGSSSNETYVGMDVDGNYPIEEDIIDKIPLDQNSDGEVNGCIKFGRSDEAKRIRKNSKKTHGKDYSPFQEKKITGLDFDKMNTLTTAVNKDNLIMQVKASSADPQCIAMRGRPTEDGINEQQLEPRMDGKTNCITSITKDNLIRQIITHDIPETVLVRKFEVDILGLQKCLKNHKKGSIKKIAEDLKVPKTNVEHWFRTDNYFSIPDADIWPALKKLLKIKTDEFDKSITEFEERDGTFDKANRVYDEDGIAPTLTSTSADEKILVRDVKQIGNNNKSNGGTQPYQQDRIYDPNGISPALAAGKSDLNIQVGDYRSDEGFRWRENGKAPTLTRGSDKSGTQYNSLAKINSRIRRLTPRECGRLQTVPEDKLDIMLNCGVSESQLYRQFGNGWNILTIAHILFYMK